MSVSRYALTHHIFFRFRWVFCQLETLRRSVNRNLRGILEKLPRTLDETYERVLKDIDEDNRDHARRLLHCLAFAIRPLRVEELAEILAFDFDGAVGGIPKFREDWRWKDQEWAVLSTCSSLITVVGDHDEYFGKCRVVQFSHFSVKEFLISDRLASSAGDVSRYHILPGSAHTILAQACLGVLLHLDLPTYRYPGKRVPLARYAAEHWVAHAQFDDVASHVKDGMQSLFDPDRHHLEAWVNIYDVDVEHNYAVHSSVPTSLYYAALCGLRDQVQHLVVSHPQLINVDGGHYVFPVLAALSKKHIWAAEFLLQHGSEVDTWGENGRTPLQMSVDPYWFEREDMADVVLFLLRHGADVNFPGSDLSTPLHHATECTSFEMVQLLLESGAEVDSRDGKGRAPLHMVRMEQDEEEAQDITRLLLERGANVNAQDNDGSTPLLKAAYRCCIDISQILLEHGADPNAKNNDSQTPLSRLFANEGRVLFTNSDQRSLVQLLLGHGANVNNQDKDHTTPLHSAIKAGSYDVAQILLEHEAEPNMANKDGNTALLLALKPKPKQISSSSLQTMEEDAEILAARLVRLLLEGGADVNAQDKRKITPLLLAIELKMYDITRMLLARGAEPNVKNYYGETPLYLLSKGAFSSDDDIPDLARLLLDRGADVNAQDQNRATPLVLAAERHLDDIAQILLERGANPNVKSTRGKTPLHLLLERIYNDHNDINDVLVVERLLLERGADVNAQDENNATPFHLACRHRRFEIAQLILNRSNAETDRRRAQLHISSEGEYNVQNIVAVFHGFHSRRRTHNRAEHGSHSPPTFGMLFGKS